MRQTRGTRASDGGFDHLPEPPNESFRRVDPHVEIPVVSNRPTLREAYYLLETLLVAPGIVSHELAHVLACRLSGVGVVEFPQFALFAPDATLVHERVDSFPADLCIAVAPLPVNTVLGLGAFAAATVAPTPWSWPFYWVGICLALTAFPSVGDTETLLDTAAGLSHWRRPVGYGIAYPVRWFTRLPGSAGVAGFVWIYVLLGGGRAGAALV